MTPDRDRVRARDLGVAPGALSPGPVNAITDVPGIRVGHTTLIEGATIRTGVTAVVHDALIGASPDGRRALPAGLAVFNGFGKMVGTTQIDELGIVETPVLLTATLSVFRVADALLSYLHELPAFAGDGSLNPVVAETNDGYLSDIWARPIGPAHVRAALDGAAGGPVAEGCVGAGTGTGALGYKAGVGTSSRLLELSAGTGPAVLGALVQANFGGVLTVGGVAIPPPADGPTEPGPPGGSCVIVLAIDVPLGSRELRRVANRAFAGMARAGSDFSGNSGDYALAISTASGREATRPDGSVPQKDLDVIFTAAIEATEEAILNSVLTAVTTTGYRGHIRRAVRVDHLRAVLARADQPGGGSGRM
ncbi:MAG: P1 family peptidase [Streptosporangiaceae bacterium]